MSEPVAALSDEQAVAALYPVRDRHLLILARPGSGKTYTLAARARFLLEEGVDPHQIPAMTFSRRAALELRERLPGGEIWAGTFHAICADILEKHGAAAGVRWPFRIVDEARCRELMAQAAGTLGCHLPSERRARDRFLHEVARRVDRRKRLGRDGHEESPEYRIPAEVVERIDEYYGQLLRDANALDYCDLISRAIEAIDGDAATAEALQQRLAFLLVDEFHDISPEQYRLVTLLAPARGGSQVLVVGDPDQAIYIGIGPLPTRTVELTVAARAWRLMQILLMACERDHDGEFLLLDIETTAIDLQRAEILEYAAIPFVKGESRPEAGIGALVRPSHPGAIAREATDIHGLRWSDVADAEDMAAHLPLLADTLRDQIVVGHNIDDFDMPLLRRVASEGEHPLGAVETIDTR